MTEFLRTETTNKEQSERSSQYDFCTRSLPLKRIGELWSVGVGDRYRALGIHAKGGINRIWIGTHAEYDKLVA